MFMHTLCKLLIVYISPMRMHGALQPAVHGQNYARLHSCNATTHTYNRTNGSSTGKLAVDKEIMWIVAKSSAIHTSSQEVTS